MSGFLLAMGQGCASDGGEDGLNRVDNDQIFSQVCWSGDARAGDHSVEEVPPLLPPLPGGHRHLLCEQAGQASQVALSSKMPRRQLWSCDYSWGLRSGQNTLISQYPDVNKGCDHRDYMACVDFTLHNRHQIVVTGIGMMSSPPRGGGRSDWCVWQEEGME